MTISEIVERNFKITKNGLVLDDIGNEYRNENGEIEYIEEPINLYELANLINYEYEAE